MPFVIDCSVSAAWCLPDETSGRASEILALLSSTEAVVPPLWLPEMANVLTVAERRRRIDPGDVEKAVAALSRLPIRIEPGDSSTMRRLIDLARRTSLSAYDASYLEVAERLGLPLASFDTAVARAAERVSVSLV